MPSDTSSLLPATTPFASAPSADAPDFLASPPRVGIGGLQYLWHENWAKIPASSHENGRTHGVAITRDGHFYVFHQAVPAVLHFDESGQLLDSWGDDFPAAHGLTLVEEAGEEFFWLTDQTSGLVAKYDLGGQRVATLEKPALAQYHSEQRYAPTWVAVSPLNGDIFLTDGYGAWLVHIYDRDGRYRFTLNGEEGAGRFKCPHGIFIDTRGEAPQLLVADRGNHRIQVYDMDGRFVRVFGADVLNSPCSFATSGELLFVPELNARLAVFGANDEFLGYLGDNGDTLQIEGWPNHPAELIEAGKFNSPHGITTDSQGNLYVVEWIIGGRITKLERISV